MAPTFCKSNAAHVFPPFAGQGISSRVRDAHQLAWRLAMLLKMRIQSQDIRNTILGGWSLERRKSVDDAAFVSMLNGNMCSKELSIWSRALLRLMSVLNLIPILRGLTDITVKKEREGMSSVEGGFLLRQFRGGARMAQIMVQSLGRDSFLSDSLFIPQQGILALLIISTDKHDELHAIAHTAVKALKIYSAVLSPGLIVLFSPYLVSRNESGKDVYWPTIASDINGKSRSGYD
ncbi:hypothetical protein C7974DRAFT_380241 [Boeremia exigua]|uniref:uncharacterized protein n=1 Tax=Boeremia exigua TaxID=749465 RepID=UPI001E8DFDCC|nr:uncharacterized protein C7974DRAFT_380241 [Boeremia exigua]KAH6615402.1 hypothetical protein C7974DRAFT_380241 [Boeremia exigua]